MGKSTTTPLVFAIGFICLAVLVWLIPTQAQDMTDEQAAAAAMDAFAEMGSNIVELNSEDVETVGDVDVDQPATAQQPVEDVESVADPLAASTAQRPLVVPTPPVNSKNSDSRVRVLLVPKREVAITSLAADTVDVVKIREGERVKKGQVLVAFACNEIEASFSVARSRLNQYTMIHDANEELFKEDAITELDLELSRSKVEEGKGEVSIARAQMERCVVKAPYSGTAAVVNVKDFANVQLGEPLLTLVDDSSYEVILNVPSLWLRSREQLQSKVFDVTVDETGKTYEATVERIGSVIDPSSRTVQLTAVIPGTNPELIPGMSGNAEIVPSKL